MKQLLFGLFSITLLLASCSKVDETIEEPVKQSEIKSLTPSIFNDYSSVNKSTSWYRTNLSFDKLFDINQIGRFYEWTGESYAPVTEWRGDRLICCYYLFDFGQYLFTDLNGDGKKDLWATYHKGPWPTDAKSLHIYRDDAVNGAFQFDLGLTVVRKQVISDFNNDSSPEIMLFSSGYDADPFPGDSLGYFTVKEKKYHYLTQDIGYFHGGATGDVDGDGFEDIVAYSGGSAIIPVHPVHYKNDGAGRFSVQNGIFRGFSQDNNYYTVELFDIDGDNKLDLFLGTRGALMVIKNEGGFFNHSSAINIQSDNSLEVMDISFLDFDGDGVKEILVMNNLNGYMGYSLKLYKFSFESHSDITENYFVNTLFRGDSAWIKWLRTFDFDGDGDLDIVGDGLFGILNGGSVVWKQFEGKFYKEQTLLNY